jgi:hypothetical protein
MFADAGLRNVLALPNENTSQASQDCPDFPRDFPWDFFVALKLIKA